MGSNVVAVSILHNAATDRWHPILFRDGPLPGPAPCELRRLKSIGHHTGGFDSKEEAVTYVRTNAEGWENPVFDPDSVAEWDGVEVPVMVVFLRDGNVVQL